MGVDDREELDTSHSDSSEVWALIYMHTRSLHARLDGTPRSEGVPPDGAPQRKQFSPPTSAPFRKEGPASFQAELRWPQRCLWCHGSHTAQETQLKLGHPRFAALNEII